MSWASHTTERVCKGKQAIGLDEGIAQSPAREGLAALHLSHNNFRSVIYCEKAVKVPRHESRRVGS